MCGIAGILSPTDSSSERRSHLKKMLTLLAHRGPDGEGIWEGGALSLGHKRLSIIDLSQKANQPMADKKGNILVFNGMIYNYKELRQELEQEKVLFKTESDTEVLLHSYARWGADVVQKIKGFFAFAVYDEKRNKLFCARDPFGKKPFYYTSLKNNFIFASEIQAVVSILEKKPSFDYHSLPYYLWKGYYPYSQTVYENVMTLQPGHAMEVDLATFRLKLWPYEQVRFQLGISSAESILESCSQFLEKSVERRLQSDVPIGVLLSGGVDSSLVSLYSAEKSRSTVSTFHILFRDKGFDESLYARQVAEKIGSKHQQIEVSADGLPEMLKKLVRVYGEPFGDPSTIPTFKVFEAIPSHIKVALTGDGGDEVFAGYDETLFFAFQRALFLLRGSGNLFGKKIPLLLSRDSNRFLRWISYLMLMTRSEGSSLFEILFSQGWTAYWRKKCLRPEIWKKTQANEVEEMERKNFLQSGCSDAERYLNSSLERLAQAFLLKVDRASMWHGIEARSPFLDLDLFHWAHQLSFHDLVSHRKPKAILKALLAQKMGSHFSDRPKQGFAPPLAHWLAQEKVLRWAEKELLQPQGLIYSLFDPQQIKNLLNEHLSNKPQTERIWTLLFLNEWHRQFS